MKTRLAAIALAPALALFVFAGAFVADRWSRYETSDALRKDTELASFAGEFAHRLQIERGLSTWGLRSGEVETPALLQARQATDATMRPLQARLDQEIRGNSAANGPLASALRRDIGNVPALRQRVSARTIGPELAFLSYTSIVEDALAMIGNVARQNASLSPEVGQALRVYDAIAIGKEFAGRERALGAAALTAPRLKATDISRAVALEGAQNGAFQSEPGLNSGPMALQWRAFTASPETRTVEDMRRQAIAAVGARPPITPAQWFAATSARIEILRRLEVSAQRNATTLLRSDSSHALAGLALALALSALAVVGAVAVSVIVSRSITGPLARLTQATHDLAQGNLEVPIASDTQTNEIKAMSEALQVFRESMRANQALSKELAEADRMASLGALVAGIAHEVNTPVGNALMVSSAFSDSVRNFGEELRSGTVRRSSIERHLRSAEDAAGLLEINLKRAADQIRSFKQVASDQTSNKRRTFDLKKCIEDAARSCTPLLRAQRVELVLDLEAEIVMESQPGVLTQAIVNLIENAVKHGVRNSSAGRVRIEAKTLSLTHARISVEDNGVGVPEELRNKIFSAFFTTRGDSGGTGLGLHIVKSIVCGQLGGEIALEQSHEGGARFVIDVPLCAPQQDGAAPADPDRAETEAA